MEVKDGVSNTYNFFVKIINALDLDRAIRITINIIIILIAAFIANKVIVKLVDKIISKQSKLKIGIDKKRVNTISAVLKSTLKYIVYFFALSAILYQFFGPISFTLASIGGVAIGLGAQNLIKDVVNGFFMVFEDHFSVGDYITMGTKSGVVQSIGIRLTKLKDFNGDLHIIPNGNVSEVTNHSRNNMRVLVDVDVAYEENIDDVFATLQEVCDKFKDNENIMEGPKVLGVSALKDSGVNITVWAAAKPMTQWDCEREIRKEIKLALDKKGIEIPYPKMNIYTSK